MIIIFLFAERVRSILEVRTSPGRPSELATFAYIKAKCGQTTQFHPTNSVTSRILMPDVTIT